MNRNLLITCATGDTWRAGMSETITLALTVRAMVHGKDDRSVALEEAGCRSRAGRSPQYRYNPRGHGRH
jgi:NAD(P)H dehydrogenase (quinone)